MTKRLFRKWTIVCLAIVLIMTQTVVYATDVVIEDPTPDLTAPAINSISVSSTELTPTTPVKVIADITDELSGFKDGYIIYTKSNNQRINAPFVYNASTKLYEANISAVSNDPAGSWKATTIYLRDKKDNDITLSHNSTQTNGQKIDFTPLHLNVSGVTPTPQPTDKEAPILRSIGVNVNQLTVNDRLQLTAVVTDNESGVASVVANYRKPSGATKSISLSSSGNDKFVGSYTIGKYDESGEWVLVSVTARDRVGNSKTYTSYQDSNNKTVNFNNCLVIVSGTIIDNEAPVLRDISVTSRVVHPNEKIEVRAEVTDNESGVGTVRVTYKKPDGSTSTIDLRKDATGQFVGSVTVGQYEERGLRTLTSVYLSDVLGNNRTITSYNDKNNQPKTFEHCTVEVTGTTPDWEGPEFTSGSITVKQISNVQAEVILTIGVEDQLSGVANGTLTGHYKKPSGRLFNLNFTKIDGNKYRVSVPIDKYDELGEYVLAGLTVRDNVGNTSTAKTLGVSILSEFNFNVLGKITITPGTPNSILVSAPAEMNRGQSHQLNPILEYSNAAIQPLDITRDPLTKYTSSNPSLLTVSAQGLIQVPANAGSGYATVEVTYGNVRKTVEIKVNGGATESYLSVTPLMVTMHSGQSEQIKVVEINDGERKDITKASSGITYTSSNPAAVTVTPDGLIQATSSNQQGTFYINMAYKGLKATTTVKLSQPVVKSLAISPTEETLSLTNNKLQLVLKAFMNDGTSKDVTKETEGTKYTSSDPKRARVDANGLVVIPPDAISGTVTIKATNNNLVVQSVLTIDGNPELTGIKITTDKLSVFPGEEKQLSVVSTYSNDTTKDISASSAGTTYTTSNPARALVDAEGKVTIPKDASLGTVVITVNYETFRTTAILTVVKDTSNDILSIEVDPSAASLMPEETQQVKVTAKMGNDTLKDITASIAGTTYSSSNTERALVDAEGLITIPSSATAGTVVVSVKNGSFQKSIVLTITKDPAKELKSISIKPNPITLYVGKEQQLTVTALMGDGSEKDVTQNEKIEYTSSIPTRASVDPTGLIAIPAEASLGTVVITAKIGTQQASVTVTVEPDPSTVVKGLSITPNPITKYSGETQQLTVLANMGDGSQKDMTASEGIAFTSSNPARATVDAAGLISIPADATLGTVVITAKIGTQQASVTVTVEQDPSTVVKGLSITPNPLTIQTGETQQLTVKRVMGDGSETDVTSSQAATVYSSSNTERAVVSAEGLVTIPTYASAGTVIITAQNGAQKSTVTVTVTKNPATEIKSLSITPNPITTHAGKTQQLTVLANMGDGSQKDMTASEGIAYTSSIPTRASVDPTGLITIPAEASLGTVVITAKIGTQQASVTVTVEQDPSTVVKGLSITPNPLTIQTGETQQLTVKRVMGDGSETDVTSSQTETVYSSSNTERAVVSAEGLVTIPTYASAGTVVITAKNGNKQTTLMVTVKKNPATEIKSMVISPDPITMHAGKTQQLTVLANMGDGSQQNMTNNKDIQYTSSIPTRAVVDASGLVSIPSDATLGTVVITASIGTSRTSVTVTVGNDPATEVKGLSITPTPLTIQTGETQQLTVKMIMGDGSEREATSSAAGTTYLTSNTERAEVNAEGFVTIPTYASAGTVVITAKNGNKQTTLMITVKKNPATEIKSMVISPDPLTMHAGKTQQLTVLANMGDGSQQDMTNNKDIQYTSSIPARAVVNALGQVTIPDDATFGTVVITATIGSSRTSVTVTVGRDPATEVSRLTFNPNSLALQTGSTYQLRLDAVMGDGSQRDITSSSQGTEYSSSILARATVDAEGLVTIPINASAGTVVITAKNGRMQTTVVITVSKDLSTEVKGILVTPNSATLAVGGNLQLNVVGTMGDGSLKDITSGNGTLYTSSNTARAIVDADGRISIPSNATLGTATITVRNGSITSSLLLTISKDPASEIKSITITPEEVSLTAGSTQQLSVIALMGDDSLKDLTSSITETIYTSSNSSRAAVDSEGNITIPTNATLGTATITVKNGKFSKSVVIRVVK